MASVERIGVKLKKEKRQWRFSRPNGLATEGEPWPCKRSRNAQHCRYLQHVLKNVSLAIQESHGCII